MEWTGSYESVHFSIASNTDIIFKHSTYQVCKNDLSKIMNNFVFDSNSIIAAVYNTLAA